MDEIRIYIKEHPDFIKGHPDFTDIGERMLQEWGKGVALSLRPTT
jgi:hypothetical protein